MNRGCALCSAPRRTRKTWQVSPALGPPTDSDALIREGLHLGEDFLRRQNHDWEPRLAGHVSLDGNQQFIQARVPEGIRHQSTLGRPPTCMVSRAASVDVNRCFSTCNSDHKGFKRSCAGLSGPRMRTDFSMGTYYAVRNGNFFVPYSTSCDLIPTRARMRATFI